MAMYKRKYTAADKREDAKLLKRKRATLANSITAFTNMWEDGCYEEAAAMIPMIEKAWDQVKCQIHGMQDWQKHGVLVSHAD